MDMIRQDGYRWNVRVLSAPRRHSFGQPWAASSSLEFGPADQLGCGLRQDEDVVDRRRVARHLLYRVPDHVALRFGDRPDVDVAQFSMPTQVGFLVVCDLHIDTVIESMFASTSSIAWWCSPSL